MQFVARRVTAGEETGGRAPGGCGAHPRAFPRATRGRPRVRGADGGRGGANPRAFSRATRACVPTAGEGRRRVSGAGCARPERATVGGAAGGASGMGGSSRSSGSRFRTGSDLAHPRTTGTVSSPPVPRRTSASGPEPRAHPERCTHPSVGTPCRHAASGRRAKPSRRPRPPSATSNAKLGGGPNCQWPATARRGEACGHEREHENDPHNYRTRPNGTHGAWGHEHERGKWSSQLPTPSSRLPQAFQCLARVPRLPMPSKIPRCH